MGDFKTPNNIEVPVGAENKVEQSPVEANYSELIRLHANIPKRYENAKFEAITDEQQKLVDKIRKNITGKPIEDVRDMLAMGTVGTGKTHIIVGALNKLINAGVFCRYATEYELLDLYFRKEYTKFDGFKQVKFLVIDEIGKRELQDWQKIQIEELISYRYNEMLPTVFITNLNESEFKKFVGDRISDRMRDNSVIRVSLTGESIRGTK